MSPPPTPPGRSLWKKSRCPSLENLGPASRPAPLIGAPGFTGVCQGQPTHSRRDIQISVRPSPPARSEVKYRLSSSGENVAFISPAAVLTTLPRFTGVVHSAFVSEKLG